MPPPSLCGTANHNGQALMRELPLSARYRRASEAAAAQRRHKQRHRDAGGERKKNGSHLKRKRWVNALIIHLFAEPAAAKKPSHNPYRTEPVRTEVNGASCSSHMHPSSVLPSLLFRCESYLNWLPFGAHAIMAWITIACFYLRWWWLGDDVRDVAETRDLL